MEAVKRTGIGQPNICFTCARACGGCSWTGTDGKGKLLWEPVPGWTAEKVRMNVGNKKVVDTYHITACPLYSQEKPRKRKCTYLELTEAESQAFLEQCRMGVY